MALIWQDGFDPKTYYEDLAWFERVELIEDALAGLLINGVPETDIAIMYRANGDARILVQGVCKYEFKLRIAAPPPYPDGWISFNDLRASREQALRKDKIDKARKGK